jgi:hypothetical protein
MNRLMLLLSVLGLITTWTTTTIASPVLVYHMDESTGTISDASGNGNTGAFAGAVVGDYGQLGRFGTALRFHGAQEIDAGNGFDLNDRSFTIETWIKPDSVQGRSKNELIASKPEGSPVDGDTSRKLHLRLGGPECGWPGPNGLLMGFYNPDLPTSANVVTDNRWQHVAFVFQKNESAPYDRYIYVNGVQVAHDTPATAYLGTGGHFYLGSWHGSEYLHGQLDEFRVYDEALNAATVARHADGVYADHAVQSPLMVMHLDDSTGTIADSTGNYAGTYTGTGLRQPGRSGQAIYFDGVDDRISVASDGVLDFDNRSFTIEMWAKQELNPTGEQCVASKKDTGGADNKDMHLRIYADGAMRFDWYANASDASAGSFTPGLWHHLAFTYDYDPVTKKGVRRIFCDGDIKVEDANVLPYLGTGGPLYLGSWGDSQYFNGWLDEARVYNYALDPGTVLAHYNLEYAEFPVPEPGSLAILTVGLVVVLARRGRRR